MPQPSQHPTDTHYEQPPINYTTCDGALQKQPPTLKDMQIINACAFADLTPLKYLPSLALGDDAAALDRKSSWISNSPPGSKVEEYVQTDDGTYRGKTTAVGHVYEDGSKDMKSADGKIGYTRDARGHEKHWGPKDEDNFQATRDADGTIYKSFANGALEYDYPDGSVHHRSADGKTGYAIDKDGHGNHWGPKADDNYTMEKTANGIVEKHRDGRVIEKTNEYTRTTYPDNHSVTDYVDGQHVVKQGDDIKSTGPSPDMNYHETKFEGHSYRDFKDGRKFAEFGGWDIFKDNKITHQEPPAVSNRQ
jgi:hypothetical protein